MTLFLTSFLLLYGLLHLYLFIKTKSALHLRRSAGFILIIILIVMLFSPLTVHFLEKYGFERSARLMSFAGYLWMGALFYYVIIALFLDLYRAVILISGRLMSRDFSKLKQTARVHFFIAIVFSILISAVGYHEATDMKIERVKIETEKIPVENSPLKIVQISDVHLGLIIREKRLRRITEIVQQEAPDIFVSTGDLVDGQINNLKGLAELLRGITARYGKYAVTGNHEYYAGIDQAIDFTKKAGLTLMRYESITNGGIINIAGVDDSAAKRYGIGRNKSDKEVLSEMDQSVFTLFLKHRPIIDSDAQGLFDLQLSGHTHKGQIFPFSLITTMYYDHIAGPMHLKNGSQLYVSRGTGTWGPPIRVLSPPEITVIELIHRDSTS